MGEFYNSYNLSVVRNEIKNMFSFLTMRVPLKLEGHCSSGRQEFLYMLLLVRISDFSPCCCNLSVHPRLCLQTTWTMKDKKDCSLLAETVCAQMQKYAYALTLVLIKTFMGAFLLKKRGEKPSAYRRTASSVISPFKSKI